MCQLQSDSPCLFCTFLMSCNFSLYTKTVWEYFHRILKIQLLHILENHLQKKNIIIVFIVWWRIDSSWGINLKFISTSQGLVAVFVLLYRQKLNS